MQTGHSFKKRGDAHDSAYNRYSGQLTATNILKSHANVINRLPDDYEEDEEEANEYTLQASLGRLSIQHALPLPSETAEAENSSSLTPSYSPTNSMKRRKSSSIVAHKSLTDDARSPSPTGGRANDGALSIRDMNSGSKRELSRSGSDNQGPNAADEHEPKSAFHLILGERFAVEDIWQKVAAEEQAILAALEVEEDKAMHRIRLQEAKSLENVQRVWMERQMNVVEMNRAVSKERENLLDDKNYLQSRKEEVVTNYKEQTQAFYQSFQELEAHRRAVHEQSRELRHAGARAEVLNIGLSDRIKETSNELMKLQNAANGQEEKMRAYLKQLQPGYTRPLDFSDIKGMEPDQLFNGPGLDPHGELSLQSAIFGNQQDLAFQWNNGTEINDTHQFLRGYGESGVEGALGTQDHTLLEGVEYTDPMFHSSASELASYMVTQSPANHHVNRPLDGQYTSTSKAEGAHGSNDTHRVHIKAAKPPKVEDSSGSPPMLKLQNKAHFEGYSSASRNALVAKRAIAARGKVNSEPDRKDQVGAKKAHKAEEAVGSLVSSTKANSQRRAASKSPPRDEKAARLRTAALAAATVAKSSKKGQTAGVIGAKGLTATAAADKSHLVRSQGSEGPVLQSLHGVSLNAEEAKNLTHVTSDEYEREAKQRNKYLLEGTHAVGSKGTGLSFKSDAEIKRLTEFKARRDSLKKYNPQYAPPSNRIQSRKSISAANSSQIKGKMSEFEEIQQSLHPFSMGNSSSEGSLLDYDHAADHHEFTWKDKGGTASETEKYNSDSDSAAEGEQKGASERHQNKSGKVMRKAAHHDEFRKHEESVKAAHGYGQSKKAALPAEARAQYNPNNKSNVSAKKPTMKKKRELPEWQ